MSSNGHHDDQVGHEVPLKILFATGFVLLVLTVVTVAVAKLDFGAFNIGVALAIAVLKASLVVLFFMHLRWDRLFNSFIFVGSVCFVLLFIGFALMDSDSYKEDLIPGNGTAAQARLDQIAGQ